MQTMFPDSDITKSFRCGKDKTSYIASFGVVDFIKRDFISKVTGRFVLMFDESLNRTSKMKQLDLHECVDPLDLRNLVSISIDGPNWLENQPVIERALEVWPSLTKLVKCLGAGFVEALALITTECLSSGAWLSIGSIKCHVAKVRKTGTCCTINNLF
ncbi:hypothetical protein DNTS_029616 [Danionella cerebrum]|uniref:Uncharacterized protein n=1 Tax=Danionella cerebrum TaxID=2873325 RepID=A0A553N5P4_9TELE|nr:hypothetical protein DNTS_029616 [Danionella translucida]